MRVAVLHHFLQTHASPPPQPRRSGIQRPGHVLRNVSDQGVQNRTHVITCTTRILALRIIASMASTAPALPAGFMFSTSFPIGTHSAAGAATCTSSSLFACSHMVRHQSFYSTRVDRSGNVLRMAMAIRQAFPIHQNMQSYRTPAVEASGTPGACASPPPLPRQHPRCSPRSGRSPHKFQSNCAEVGTLGTVATCFPCAHTWRSL